MELKLLDDSRKSYTLSQMRSYTLECLKHTDNIGFRELNLVCWPDSPKGALGDNCFTDDQARGYAIDTYLMCLEGQASYQEYVGVWMIKCFGEVIPKDQDERNFRFLEEALELVQAKGCSKEDTLRLVDYVYARDVGEPEQEVGGVMVTLAALCNASMIDMMTEGFTELNRISGPAVMLKIRAKQAAKPIKGGALPGPTVPETPPDVYPSYRFDMRHVESFAYQMKQLMIEAGKDGKVGWENAIPDYLWKLLIIALEKGNLISAANYCMMINNTPVGDHKSFRRILKSEAPKFHNSASCIDVHDLSKREHLENLEQRLKTVEAFLQHLSK